MLKHLACLGTVNLENWLRLPLDTDDRLAGGACRALISPTLFVVVAIVANVTDSVGYRIGIQLDGSETGRTGGTLLDWSRRTVVDSRSIDYNADTSPENLESVLDMQAS